MESRAKFLGHGMHPILIVFPLGLLSTSVIFDVIHIVTGNPTWAVVAFWMIAAGVVGGLLAALFGFIDFLAIPNGTRAKRVGRFHGLANLVVVILFASSWALRYPTPESPPVSAHALSFVAFIIALVGGWLGGELVERLGVAVHDGANLDAPNSLTHKHVPRAT